MDCEDLTVFTDAMELHYIDMKAFAKAVNEKDSINIEGIGEAMFAKWLSVITSQEINSKTIIENAFNEEEEIRMAVTALQRQSENKIIRQAYARRKDEIYFQNMHIERAKQAEQRAGQAEAENKNLQSVVEEQAALIAKLQSKLKNEP